MTVLDELCRRIVGTSPRDYPPALTVHTLDTVGAWIAGRATREGGHLSRLRWDAEHRPALFDASALDTVALRVATARLTEIDDIHMPSCTTPGSVILMTALSLAPAIGDRADPACFAPAMLAGYDVMTRFGEALSGPALLHRGYWPTFMLAPITAAAVSARILGLDAERTAHALAIALTMSTGRPGGSISGGVTGGTGTSARWLFVGLAARIGCAAALSAAAGFNGDRALLDGEWPQRSHGIELSPTRLLALFDGPPAIEAMSIKPYCAAKHCIAAIDGFTRLLEGGLALEVVTRVRVKVPPSHAAMIGHHDFAASRLSRITSCAYNLGLAAYRPHDLLDIERAEPVDDPAVAAFAKMVEVAGDDELVRRCPAKYPAALEVFAGENLLASITIDDALGDPALPFDLDAAKRKFRRLVGGIVDAATASDIERTCLDLADHPDAASHLSIALSDIDRRLVAPPTTRAHSSAGPSSQSIPTYEAEEITK